VSLRHRWQRQHIFSKRLLFFLTGRAKSIYLKLVVLDLESVLCRYVLLKNFNALILKLDDAAASRTNQVVVVVAFSSLELVAGISVRKSTFLRDAGKGK